MDINDQTTDLLHHYEEQRNQATAIQDKLNNISHTATSPRREVTVTAGHGGTLLTITFPTSAYKRLTPTELTTAITTTYNEARNKANDQAAQILQPLLPHGLNAHALIAGQAKPEDLIPDGPQLPPTIREALQHNWRQQ
jgi:DNA-binding protein YbaB